MLEQARVFFRESYQELRKVTWPGRKEIWGSTLVVVFAVVICTALVAVADLIIQWCIGIVLK